MNTTHGHSLIAFGGGEGDGHHPKNWLSTVLTRWNHAAITVQP